MESPPPSEIFQRDDNFTLEGAAETEAEIIARAKILRSIRIKLLLKHLRQSRVISVGLVFIFTCLLCAGIIEIYLRVFLPEVRLSGGSSSSLRSNDKTGIYGLDTEATVNRTLEIVQDRRNKVQKLFNSQVLQKSKTKTKKKKPPSGSSQVTIGVSGANSANRNVVSTVPITVIPTTTSDSDSDVSVASSDSDVSIVTVSSSDSDGSVASEESSFDSSTLTVPIARRPRLSLTSPYRAAPPPAPSVVRTTSPRLITPTVAEVLSESSASESEFELARELVHESTSEDDSDYVELSDEEVIVVPPPQRRNAGGPVTGTGNAQAQPQQAQPAQPAQPQQNLVYGAVQGMQQRLQALMGALPQRPTLQQLLERLRYQQQAPFNQVNPEENIVNNDQDQEQAGANDDNEVDNVGNAGNVGEEQRLRLQLIQELIARLEQRRQQQQEAVDDQGDQENDTGEDEANEQGDQQQQQQQQQQQDPIDPHPLEQVRLPSIAVPVDLIRIVNGQIPRGAQIQNSADIVRYAVPFTILRSKVNENNIEGLRVFLCSVIEHVLQSPFIPEFLRANLDAFKNDFSNGRFSLAYFNSFVEFWQNTAGIIHSDPGFLAQHISGLGGNSIISIDQIDAVRESEDPDGVLVIPTIDSERIGHRSPETLFHFSNLLFNLINELHFKVYNRPSTLDRPALDQRQQQLVNYIQIYNHMVQNFNVQDHAEAAKVFYNRRRL